MLENLRHGVKVYIFGGDRIDSVWLIPMSGILLYSYPYTVRIGDRLHCAAEEARRTVAKFLGRKVAEEVYKICRS